MEILGLSLLLIVLFVSFGFMVGVLFGFFGMGGAFLITPTLLILDYPASVAIGSGLAFYFGTSVIAVMKHYDVGQVDYKLGAILFVFLAIGIELGSILVFGLEELGIAELVTGIAYVVLLAGIGLLFLRRAAAIDAGDGPSSDGSDEMSTTGGSDEMSTTGGSDEMSTTGGSDEMSTTGGGDEMSTFNEDDGASKTGPETNEPVSDDEIPAIAQRIQSYRIPPMISLLAGGRASVWTISGAGGVVGVVSGMLGVGGGFLRMPAIYYLIGTPLSVAVGTSLFAGLFSGAFGAFTYGTAGAVDLVVVSTLLVGSALGARIGSAATTTVDEDDVIVYFGIMMLLASFAIGLSELANWLNVGLLDLVSVGLLVGSSFVVGSMILYRALLAFRSEDTVQSLPTPES